MDATHEPPLRFPWDDPPLPADGLKFDTGFNADYWMGVKTFSTFDPELTMNCAVLRTNGALLNGNGFPLDYGAYSTGFMGVAPTPLSA